MLFNFKLVLYLPFPLIASFFFLFTLNVCCIFSIFAIQNEVNSDVNDPFGIEKIYPTKQGGREWFMNMSNPESDPTVTFTFNPTLIKQNDGSWKPDKNEKVRINVDTPHNLPEWKNVEITGYVKIDSLFNSTEKDAIRDVDWVSRTDRHSENLPCYGLALHGGIYPDGSVAWKKQIWFTGGYTKEKSVPQITEPIINRWIGWKVAVYNINNDTAVKMESYLDSSNSNYWTKVFEMTDNGNWFANSSDDVFYSANCGRSKDHIILNPGPMITFRTDNVALNFKDFSIREIAVPSQKQ
ncbi:MAG: hypothetical protein H0X50_02960 [Nitrosopumilus sp.]|nr:hypothetical protein [Nitrosopumilus sp.]